MTGYSKTAVVLLLQLVAGGEENEGVALPVGRPMNIEVTLDCNNLEDLARFWQEALGCEAYPTVPGEYLSLTSSGGFTLNLQAVPEPKVGKNRMHLDLLVSDVAATATHFQSVGATVVSERMELHGTRWYVMADPEGNEFCLAAMTERPDHELEVLEDDQTVPPRPEELIADASRDPAPSLGSPVGDANFVAPCLDVADFAGAENGFAGTAHGIERRSACRWAT
jgi:predicted enzyme related to lactoylglutathione lyase